MSANHQRQSTDYLSLPPLYGHYTGQPALAGTRSKELEDYVAAKFYCPHVLADGN